MQPASPRDATSRHGLEQSQEMLPGHRQTLEQREDMRLAHSSVKIMRSLCREYGISFTMPQSSTYGSSKRKDKGSRSNPSSGNNSPEPSSSSSSDLEERQEDVESYARWPAVKELLDGLQTHRRVSVLKEISKSLNESAERAEQNIKDFDSRAAGAGSHARETSPENVVDQELLHFDPSETSAAKAVRRFQAMMPELKQLAVAQAEASKASMLRALKEAEALSAEAAEEVSDSDASDGEKQNDIERKFQQLGDLPAGAHPDLQIVLDLQREEIRATAQRIKDAERDLQIKKCALEYVDGKLSMMNSEGDQDLFNSCITLAQEMKATIYTRQKEEAERKLIQDQKNMNVPTEDEVQEQILESERLAAEVAVAAEQVRKLQEMSAAAVATAVEPYEGAAAGSHDDSSEEGEKPEGEEEEGAREQKHARKKSQVIYLQEGTEGAPKVVVDLARVPEVHKELSKKAAALEEQIAAEDKRISNAEGIMRNAEQTLKVLEEAKTLLLEHVAREKPALIEGLLPPPDTPDEPLEDDEQGGSTTPSSDEGQDEEDEEEKEERLKSLASEEQRIRSQLAEAAEGDENREGNSSEEEEAEGQEKEEEGQAKRRYGLSEAAEPQPKKDYGARCTRGLQRLAKRLREDPDAGGDADAEAEADSDSSSASSNSPRIWTPPPELTREEAVSQLRSMPHEELQTLLRLRNDNERLMKQIDQARRELERLRVKQGNPKALLAAEDPEGMLEEGVPPELVVEVRRKVRELCALRKRWWRDRQHESTTVRRSLAAMNLPEDADTDDHPPPAAQDSLFQRIHASMTLP